jgi:hypothetical protein
VSPVDFIYTVSHHLQEVSLSEAKAKALDDAAMMRKELQDQHEQQERVAAQVRVEGNRYRLGLWHSQA